MNQSLSRTNPAGMDESTEGVTLLATFLLGVRAQYADTPFAARPLFEMTRNLTPEQPFAWVEMRLYNDMCAWIESNLGAASIRRAGLAIGTEVFNYLSREVAARGAPASTPHGILLELQRAAREMIRDPRGRGWEILEVTPNVIRMRRTQTFNCMLQEGLLRSLVEATGVKLVSVHHDTCTRRGDPFCEYIVRWSGILARPGTPQAGRT